MLLRTFENCPIRTHWLACTIEPDQHMISATPTMLNAYHTYSKQENYISNRPTGKQAIVVIFYASQYHHHPQSFFCLLNFCHSEMPFWIFEFFAAAASFHDFKSFQIKHIRSVSRLATVKCSFNR